MPPLIDHRASQWPIHQIAEEFKGLASGLNSALCIVHILFQAELWLSDDFLHKHTAHSDQYVVLNVDAFHDVLSGISSMDTVVDIEIFFNTPHAKLENRTPASQLMKYMTGLQHLLERLDGRLNNPRMCLNFTLYLETLGHRTVGEEDLLDRMDYLVLQVQQLQTMSAHLVRMGNILGTDNRVSKMLEKIECADRADLDMFARIINLEKCFSKNDEFAFFMKNFEKSIKEDEYFSAYMMHVKNTTIDNVQYSMRLAKLENYFACCRQYLFSVSNSRLADLIQALYKTTDSISEAVDLHLKLIGDEQPNSQIHHKQKSVSRGGHSSSLPQYTISSTKVSKSLDSFLTAVSIFDLDGYPPMIDLLRLICCMLKAVAERAIKGRLIPRQRAEMVFWALAREGSVVEGAPTQSSAPQSTFLRNHRQKLMLQLQRVRNAAADVVRSEQAYVVTLPLPGAVIDAEHESTTLGPETDSVSRRPGTSSPLHHTDPARVYPPEGAVSDRTDSYLTPATPFWRRMLPGCCRTNSQKNDPNGVTEFEEDKGLESSG